MPAWHIAARTGASLVRSRVDRLRTVEVPIDGRGTRIVADLATPFGLSLFRYGLTEPEARLISRLLRPGDVFVDAGAHIGIFTLTAAAVVGPQGRVVALEPVPENMRLLRANLALNGFEWVDAQEVALGEDPGEAEFFSFGSGSALGSFAPVAGPGSRSITVEVSRLDDVVGSRRDRVRLVKLDVEGAELKALRGADLLLREAPDFIIELEPDHLARQGASVDAVQEMFERFGYRPFSIRPHGREVTVDPMATWGRPEAGNPNILVSTRPDPLPAVR